MGFWEMFWIVSIILALVSFTILSLRVLIKGYSEVQNMLSALEKGRDSSEETE